VQILDFEQASLLFFRLRGMAEGIAEYVIRSIGVPECALYISVRDLKSLNCYPKEVVVVSVVNAELPRVKGAMVVRSGEGEKLNWGPTGKIRILGGANSTARSFSIVECIEPPGSGAPLHVHHAEAEAFYILEGSVELTCGDEKLTAHAGDFVYTPKDVAHKFTVVGDRPGRLLMMFSRPGFEMFFSEGGSPVEKPMAGPPDMAQFKRLVEKYEMELLEAPAH
jgi:mannose-6-phosphate isomerase-like protein (cupin superfamily)